MCFFTGYHCFHWYFRLCETEKLQRYNSSFLSINQLCVYSEKKSKLVGKKQFSKIVKVFYCFLLFFNMNFVCFIEYQNLNYDGETIVNNLKFYVEIREMKCSAQGQWLLRPWYVTLISS